MSRSWIGKPVLRKEGRDKVTGETKYIDDLSFPGMIYGITVRSSIPRGRIQKIEFEKGVPWNEITVVTSKDIPGKNAVALILYDQPFLAEELIHHPEEPILLLAHPDKHLLEEARRLVRIEYEVLPPVLTLEESLRKKEIIWGQDNLFKSYLLEKGSVDEIWEKADLIVEGEYWTEAQEQLYIENNGIIATANPQDGVTVWGSMQCPYYIHKALLPLFGLPEDKIRIIQTSTGGGFGGKEEYPSLIAGHAALLAWKTRKPVKLIYDRAEDMAATTKRHPSRTRHKTAVSREGKLLAMEIDFAIDGGAYATLSAVVLSRGTIHAAGPYLCPHVRITSQACATNTPPQGAFRGFGAPQSIFALERHLNQIAKKVGMSPEEIRKRNFLREGDRTATHQLIHEKIQLDELLESALKESQYSQKRTAFQVENSRKGPIRKGIGFATFMHGAGFTGSGEKALASVVGVEATAEGKIRILSASTEIGQGTNTIFSQIAADALSVDPSSIEVAQPDTRSVPNSGPTVASRTCMVVGKLVETAALSLRQTLLQSQLLKEPYNTEQFERACQEYIRKVGPLKTLSQYQQPANIHWDDTTYQGDAYGTYAWAAYVATVTVDMRTYEIKIDDFVAVQEVGKVIHPILAAGQIEGGIAQGIGYALCEKVVWKEGRMANNRMTNYIVPTAADVPPIRTFFREQPYSHGPHGAKGIGELPMDGPAPAILNAVEDALGVSIHRIPLLSRGSDGGVGGNLVTTKTPGVKGAATSIPNVIPTRFQVSFPISLK